MTTTSSARPEIGIEIGTNTRKARYVSGSGSVKLRFEYAVAEGDADTDGIAIAANALADAHRECDPHDHRQPGGAARP